MKIKNVRIQEYFRSADGCKIAETFGIPSEKISEASVAYAILPSGRETAPHSHAFTEWYIITAGDALMRMGGEEQRVSVGDNILIEKGRVHSIKNTGKKDLEFYCFCVPAFTLTGTKMTDGSKAAEDIKRDFGSKKV